MPSEEIVALVDEDGRPAGVAPRWQVRRDNLRHRATAVLVRDAGGRLYVHRRSAAKDWAPSHHDAAAGGVLTVGEEPEPAARRELAEELGIQGVGLRPLLVAPYDDATTRYIAHVFTVTWDGPVVHADGEVAWGTWMTLPDLGVLLRDREWRFVPDTRALLARLAADGVEDYARLGQL